MASQQPYMVYATAQIHLAPSQQQLHQPPYTYFRSASKPSFSSSITGDKESWLSQETPPSNNMQAETERTANAFPHPRIQKSNEVDQQGFHGSSQALPFSTNQATAFAVSPPGLCQHNIATGSHPPERCVDPHCLTLRYPQGSSTTVSHQYPSIYAPSSTLFTAVGSTSWVDAFSTYDLVHHGPLKAPPQPIESDLRSSLNRKRTIDESQYHVSQSSIIAQYHGQRAQDQCLPSNPTTKSYPSNDDMICSVDCFSPCSTDPDACDKPNKCTSPQSHCLEPCPVPSDQCGKRSRCESEQCEKQKGYCGTSRLGQMYGSVGVHDGGFFDQSYDCMDAEGEPDLTYDEVGIGNSQRFDSVTSTSALSLNGNESIGYPYSPEGPQFAPHVRNVSYTSLMDPLDTSHLSSTDDPTFGGRPHAIRSEILRTQQQPGNLPSVLPSSTLETCENSFDTIDLDAVSIKIEVQEAFPGDHIASIPSSPSRGHTSVTLLPKDNVIRQCEWTGESGICGLSFRGNDLNQHWINAHKDEGTLCKWSGCRSQDFMKKDKLARHMITHTGYIYGYCRECPKSFNNKDNLKQHEKIHSDKEDDRVWCEECQKYLATKSSMNDHLKTPPHTTEKHLQCRWCPHRDNNAQNLKKHEKSQYTLIPHI